MRGQSHTHNPVGLRFLSFKKTTESGLFDVFVKKRRKKTKGESGESYILKTRKRGQIRCVFSCAFSGRRGISVLQHGLRR